MEAKINDIRDRLCAFDRVRWNVMTPEEMADSISTILDRVTDLLEELARRAER